MKYFGYKNRTSFWQFIHRCAVPHVRLNRRKIMFEEQALADWIDRRSIAATFGIGIDRFRGRSR
jgi:hypothetical protein